MLKYVVIDAETTTKFKGNPFYGPNKLSCLGYWTWKGEGEVFDIEYTDGPRGDVFDKLRSVINSADVVVAFNAKFDIHWLHRVGIYVPRPVWCLQVYEFIATAEATAYPSLDGALRRTGVGEKSTLIETEYWDKGIDTNDIPWEVLHERCLSDIQQEAKLYEWQMTDLAIRSKDFQALCQLEMLDLRVLEEMEWNGQKYDKEGSLQKANELEKDSAVLTDRLTELVECPHINWNSTQHKSAAIYGGEVKYERREEVGIYKTGTKIGQPRFRVHHETITLPRLLEPREGTKLEESEYYSTAEPILRDLRAKGKAKVLIDTLLARAGLEKAMGTYYLGIPKLMDEMEWTDGYVHGQFNQCVAVTGRLSSSKPNQQNEPPEVKRFKVTRFT